MKKLVLLGDSIRMSYGARVAELLEGEYAVWQPEDNCRFASYTQRMLFDYREQIKDADVIHWNNGHWDVCDLFGDGSFTDIHVYVENMKRIAKHLLSITGKVIFATTTPVQKENPHETNAAISAFNAAVVPQLQAMGVQINDLYALVAQDLDTYICEDNLHLSPEGVEVSAQQVAKAVRAANP